jgi:PAB1-binding protein PBP1
MSSKMVQGKKPQGDLGNGTNKRDISNAGFSKKDPSDSKPVGRSDGKTQNGTTLLPKAMLVGFNTHVASGTRSGFRTDTAISNSRAGQERTLQRWVPDSHDALDGSLEKSTNSGHWDQFAENERLFGLRTDYDENIYTTKIDRSHPNYKDRVAVAERKAREIEHSSAATSHVAEERIMDHVGGDDQGGDEEDK